MIALSLEDFPNNFFEVLLASSKNRQIATLSEIVVPSANSRKGMQLNGLRKIFHHLVEILIILQSLENLLDPGVAIFKLLLVVKDCSIRQFVKAED